MNYSAIFVFVTRAEIPLNKKTGCFYQKGERYLTCRKKFQHGYDFKDANKLQYVIPRIILDFNKILFWNTDIKVLFRLKIVGNNR